MDIKITKLILQNRPNLSESSVKTYLSLLRTVYTSVFGDDFDKANFDNTYEILKYLKNVNPRTRKTYLSALLIVTNEDKYKDQMYKDIDTYNKEEEKQVKNEKQSESWITNKDILDKFIDLEKEAKHIYSKKNIDMNDLQSLQSFIILALLGGLYIPPRRSMDYTNFKIRNIDNKDECNYLSGNKLIFNSYKTAKFYGRQEVIIPPKLANILKKWISVNKGEWLLFDVKNNKLTNVKLNQRINKIFGDKKVGVNQLRHTYLSNKYKHLIDTNSEMNQDFKSMGSSSSQFVNYVKKD
jgi:hypothetical protein